MAMADAWSFDVRTLAVASAAVLAMLGVVPLILQRLAPHAPAIVSWRLATALGLSSIALFAFRGDLPALLAVVVADAFAATGFAMVVVGCRQLIGAEVGRLPPALTGGVVAAISAALTWVWPSEFGRTLMIIAVIGGWAAVAAASLLRARMPAARFLGAVFAALVVVAAWRLWGLARVGETATLFAPTIERLVDFSSALLLGVAGSVGGLLLVAEVALQEMRSAAYRDALTGLANRAALEDAAAREFARARRNASPFGLLLLDVDHFKKVNDRFGHSAGDLALREVGRALRSALRREDEIGRYGGEEFLALLPGAGDREIHVVAERLRAAVERLSLSWHGKPIAITISVGGSAVRADDEGWEPALDRADAGLYAAKGEGRNRVVLRLDPKAQVPRRRSGLTTAPAPTRL